MASDPEEVWEKLKSEEEKGTKKTYFFHIDAGGEGGISSASIKLYQSATSEENAKIILINKLRCVFMPDNFVCKTCRVETLNNFAIMIIGPYTTNYFDEKKIFDNLFKAKSYYQSYADNKSGFFSYLDG